MLEALDDAGGDAAANAILTTDLVDKQVALELELDGRRVCIGGMAKGSGMIHPDMATMLGFFSCDAGVDAGVWQGMVQVLTQSTSLVLHSPIPVQATPITSVLPTALTPSASSA